MRAARLIRLIYGVFGMGVWILALIVALGALGGTLAIFGNGIEQPTGSNDSTYGS